jgi:hypothetical protein
MTLRFSALRIPRRTGRVLSRQGMQTVRNASFGTR